jgi:hypothetical protein
MRTGAQETAHPRKKMTFIIFPSGYYQNEFEGDSLSPPKGEAAQGEHLLDFLLNLILKFQQVLKNC